MLDKQPIEDRIKQSTEKLDTAADKATAMIRQKSKWLSEHGPRIPIYTEEITCDRGKTMFRLGYDRIMFGWHLVVSEPPDDNYSLAICASRTVKIAAAKHVDRLLELIADKAEKIADEIE